MEQWLTGLVEALIDWFEMPRNGLATVFLVALISATLLPLGSEPAVFGYVKLNPDQFWITVLIATVGNTLGGMITYFIGRGAKYALGRDRPTRYLGWFERFGPKTLFLAFLPVIGDPLCAVAGWLRLPVGPCAAWMAGGKLVRYVSMTALLLWVPDTFWRGLLGPFGRILGL